MMQTKAILAVLLTALFLVFAPAASRADKSEVRIEAPEKAAQGTEITIKLDVSHHGNNLIHHTEWLRLDINGKTVQKWEFSATRRPEAENFSRTFPYKVDGPLEIVSEASCNLHGSKGPARRKVDLLEE
jgi:desulfoferrodoxin (superoxide reductase-like protein)